MGKKKKPLRVVLDTNVVVSAILFGGQLSRIREFWRSGRISPFLSRATFQELKEVPEYPKFALNRKEIKMILMKEVLPYFAVTEVTQFVEGVCEDAEDHKFLSCALSANVLFLVTGDEDLRSLTKYKSVRIVSPADFLKKFD